MDILKFFKKRLHVEVLAKEASDATATAKPKAHPLEGGGQVMEIC